MMEAPDRPPKPAGREWALDKLVGELRAAGSSFDQRSQVLGRHALPSREALVRVAAELRAALFPAHFGATDVSPEGIDYFVGRTLDSALTRLDQQVRRGFMFGGEDPDAAKQHAREAMHQFIATLPRVRELLETDVRAAYEGDPAATGLDEAVFCYPGVTAITHHRLAHELYRLAVPLIPRIISEIAHSTTGIDIHPGAQIGESFFIDHGTGIVIGQTCRIGRRVRLYQGVTLGAKSFPINEDGQLVKGLDRHPIVEDDVVIYAGATLLGRITIGRGSSIGGNVWLTRSVPPDSRITQAQAHYETFQNGSGI